MESWHAVWNKRRLPVAAVSTLQGLIDLDGFDSGAGKIGEAAWRVYVAMVAGRLGIRPADSVFEIGCGSGAFLYVLREAGVRIAGLDYSENLVAAARHAMPEGDFRAATAEAFAAVAGEYDFVIANSVFHYFPDLDYARRVVDKMRVAAGRAVAILELPDAVTRGEAEAARRGLLSAEEYERKYAGLSHLYYDRNWFIELAEHHGLAAEIFQQDIAGYAQNAFRYNVLLRKREAA
jgi:trans-aconitate methyltransferase